MKKPDILKSFRSRKFKYGGYATLTTAVVLAILLVINLLTGQLDLKYDLTENKLFSLSDQTNSVLDNLKADVNIYYFVESGKQDPAIETIINKYVARSKKITLEYKDPVKYPQFAKQFSQDGTDVREGSIVVKSGSKFKLIDSSDFVNYSYNAAGQPSADSLVMEQKVTGAIINVTSDESPVLLTLKGHEERDLPYQVTKQLENENYTIKDVNLLLKDANLEEGAALLINSPKRDISTDEAAAIKDFLSKGGRAIFLMDITDNELPNFQSVLNSYGVGIKRMVVVEGDPNFSTNYPIYLVPDMGSQEIVNPLKSDDIPVLIPGAQAVELKELKKSSITIEPLLMTSKNSWGKAALNPETVEKEEGDYTGPFNLAVAVTDKSEDSSQKDTKLVVVSNGIFISSEFAGSGGNIDFLMNSVNWLQDKKESISIRPKSLYTGHLLISGFQRLLFSGIVVIVIPASIAVWGITVWLRRRHA